MDAYSGIQYIFSASLEKLVALRFEMSQP